MNAQRISLTRIIAINWYGFRQIIDVADDILIAGAFASGKSALLDLIQYVMVGEHWRSNRAASGNRKGRTLVSYCLCDTNTRRGTEPHYTRTSGATLVALEFTVPPVGKSELRRETWGVRIEFESATSKPKQTYFGIPDRLEWSDLAPDGRSLLSEEDFRRFISRDFGHECILGRQKDYLAEMAVARHLFFDRDQLNKTMPKAMAFESEADVERFIRDYILEESPIDVRDVKTAVSAYRETQQRLEKQEHEAEFLRRIAEYHEAALLAERQEAMWRHQLLALDHAQAKELAERHQGELERLKADHADDIAKLDAKLTEKTDLEALLQQIVLEAGKDPDQAKLDQLHTEKTASREKITRLKETQKTVRERLRSRAQSWAGWLKQGAAVQLDGLADKLSVDDKLLAALRAGDEARGLEALPTLAERFNDLFRGVEALLGPPKRELDVTLSKLQEIAKNLELLDRKETPGAFPLFNAIKARLVKPESPPQQLCRLIEVIEDDWREALELFLGRNRFTIVVGPSDYAAALAVFKSVPPSQWESLAHPREALELPAQVKPGSLATKIEVMHPVADRFAKHLLGGVVGVQEVEDLDAHDRAITVKGVFKQAPIRRKLRQIPGFEFTLGDEGLKRLREATLREQKTLMAVRDNGMALIERVNHWLDTGKKNGLADARLPEGSGEVALLPSLEAALKQLSERIELLSTPEREARLQRLRQLQANLGNVNQAIGALRTSNTDFFTKSKALEEALVAAEEQSKQAAIALAESRTKRLPSGILEEELSDLLVGLRRDFSTWKERTQAATERAGQAHERATNSLNARDNERRSLASAVDKDGQPLHPEYRGDFPIEEKSNDLWAARLAVLEKSELRKYRSLADDRRREWEQRLQEKVLDKLNDHLRNAERTIRQLKGYLDQPIGPSLYVFSQKRDAAFNALWHLLDTGLEATDPLVQGIKTDEIQRAKHELMTAVERSGDKEDERSKRLLDYRYYHRYNLEVVPANLPNAPAISLAFSGHNLSGGENQAPFFVSMLAAFRRVYDQGSGQYRQNVGLAVMDEAFSKLSGDGVEDCLELARNFRLQLIMAFPVDRLGVMAPYANTIIHCRKEEQRDPSGYITRIDNIPTVMTSHEVLEALE